MSIDGPRERAPHGCVRARAGAPLVHRHADRVLRHPPPAAVHGQGHAVEATAVRLAAVGARRVPGHPRHGRPRGAAPLHRGARGGRAARAVPEGERKDGPDRATAVRRRGLRRRQGRRADRAGRHRRLRAGDAEGARFIYPHKVHVIDRPADPGAASAPASAFRGRRSRSTPTGCTPSCSVCSTRRSAASVAIRPRRRACRRSRPRAPPPATAGSCDAAQLAGRVHRQLRHADVDGGDPEPGGGERSDRRAARHVVARHEDLPRHAGLGARPLEQRGRVRRRRVALVGVELDRRAGVDERPVVGLVALRVVGVHGVGVVGRHARRDRRARGGGRRACRRGRRRAVRGRVRGAARLAPVVAGRPDLLVVEEDDHRHRVGRPATRPAPTVAAQHETWLSSRPLASSDSSPPRTAAPLHVVEAQLPPRRRVDAGGVGEPLGELAGVSTSRCPTPGAGAAAGRASSPCRSRRGRGGSRAAAPGRPARRTSTRCDVAVGGRRPARRRRGRGRATS